MLLLLETNFLHLILPVAFLLVQVGWPPPLPRTHPFHRGEGGWWVMTMTMAGGVGGGPGTWNIYMDVSQNSGTPKSSGFNRVFHYFHHPFWDPYFGNTHIHISSNKITLKGILSKPSFRWWKSSQGEVSTLELRTSGKNMKPLLAPRAPLSNHIT